MTKASDNAFPSILITEGTEPTAPAAGKQRLYIDSSTHKLMRTNSSGTETSIEADAASLNLPTLVQAPEDAYAGSGTTVAVTMDSTPTQGNYMYAVIGSTGRGCDSITQTNVAWTKLYGGNGNSQYLEVWQGVISASAATLVTANFTGSNKQEMSVIELTVDIGAAGSAVTTTSAGRTLWSCGPVTTTPGQYVVAGVSANAPSTGILTALMPSMVIGPDAGTGQVNSRLVRSVGGSLSAWGETSSSVAQFAAIVPFS